MPLFFKHVPREELFYVHQARTLRNALRRVWTIGARAFRPRARTGRANAVADEWEDGADALVDTSLNGETLSFVWCPWCARTHSPRRCRPSVDSFRVTRVCEKDARVVSLSEKKKTSLL